jgi:predicted HicB family RNase H-like nuclease
MRKKKEKPKVVTVRMSEEEHKRIVQFCERKDISLNSFMRIATLRVVERDELILELKR